MLNFELGKEINKDRCFPSCIERGTKKKFWVLKRNRISDLRIPRSDALPLSHRDSTVSEVYFLSEALRHSQILGDSEAARISSSITKN